MIPTAMTGDAHGVEVSVSVTSPDGVPASEAGCLIPSRGLRAEASGT